jgi:hypothetical protein
MPTGYRWLSYSQAASHIPDAEAQGVSEVARSPRGFMGEYKRAGSAAKMRDRPVPGYPNQTWGDRRDNFIRRHLAQYRLKATPRRRLALLMWAFNPDGAT